MTVSTEAARPRVSLDVAVLRAYWHRVALGGVLLLAALLDFVKLGQNGYANTYYSAAVRSMGQSWHNFFFASFDPGGLVSVDKPPLALWLEVASTKLFGYSGTAILLPEAVAGVAAVAVLYALVARYFGRVAGLVAALALAVSPVSVAVNRDNNPDALFALLLVVAAYFGARAVESGRLRHVLLTGAAVGLAFNAKMLAALIVVPGLALAYAAFASTPWKTRILHLATALGVMVAVGGAWIAAVELTPASDRPYVGSTDNNSALSLLWGYNGLGRINGQEGGTSTGGGPGGGAFSGSPGMLRLLNDALGDQAAWLLPLALAGGLAAAIILIRGRKRLQLGVFTIVAGWFAAGAFVFSFAGGIVHTYYLSALAPATCALVGIGAVALATMIRRGGLWLLLPAAALVGTAWLQVDLLRRSGYLPGLQTAVVLTMLAAGTLIVLALFRESRALAVAAVAVAVGGALVAPAAWSATTWKSAVNGVFPGAGPSFVSGLGGQSTAFAGGPPMGMRRGGAPAGGPPGMGGGGSTSQALAYAKSHGATSRFALIVSSEQSAAQYVIDGEAVASMGGFTGRETVLDPSYLSHLVASGEARWFLIDGGGRGGVNEAATTISSACTLVPATSWNGSSGSLYDCAGKAAALAG